MTDKLGDKPTIIVHDRQNRLIYKPILFTKDKLRDIPTNIVNDRQNWIYQPLLSTTDKIG